MRRAALVAMLVLAACETDPARVVVAWIDDRPIALSDWQRYSAENLLELAGEPPADDRVQSRLFDAFVNERLLMAEAERRGLTASDPEVEAWLGFAGDLAEEAVTAEQWEAARRRVMMQKLEEEVAGEATEVARVEPTGAREEAAPVGRFVRLSSLRFEEIALAEEVAGEITAGRMMFDEALTAHGTPQDGVPVDLAWDSLRVNHRLALEDLRPGQVSAPVEVGGAIYLFRVEAWLEPAAVGAVQDERERRRIERSRRQAAFNVFLLDLRKKDPIRINVRALPFRYVADDDVS